MAEANPAVHVRYEETAQMEERRKSSPANLAASSPRQTNALAFDRFCKATKDR